MTNKTITVNLKQLSKFQFSIDFDESIPKLLSDESPPLGEGKGPSPVQLLSAAVGNCLSDSLFFALMKFHQSPEPIHTTVQAEVGRNAEGRMRVIKVEANLQLGVPANKLEHLDRVLDQFEDFCTVSKSVGLGIPIHIRVLDSQGLVLKD
jgi:uncharacterized OsmC-like protein